MGVEGVGVEDTTVTVLLRVYAGVDVQVTLDGQDADQVEGPPPILRYVFENVAPGTYEAQVRDVVGHHENLEVVVPQVAEPAVSFNDLFASPDTYRGTEILLEGFFFMGTETIVLSELLEPSGQAAGHVWPKGRMVWVEGSIPSDIYGRPLPTNSNWAIGALWKRAGERPL
ncbi:MAG: hypothetical protein C1O27_001648 [Chloroflexi bacterium]|jgi:hypothetical protein|nr:MAG: hypothetical protein C1O27_001648 [Chloroflexota bacterium]